MEGISPQFLYWSKTLDIEVLFLQFLRAQREANYPLYIKSLSRMLPYIFATDHYNYARWLSVHLADLKQLPTKCPDVHEEFVNGKFVTQKTKITCLHWLMTRSMSNLTPLLKVREGPLV